MEAKIKSVIFYNSNTEITSFYVLAEKNGRFAKFLLKKKMRDAMVTFEHSGTYNFIIDKEKKPTESYHKGQTIKMFNVLDIVPVEKLETVNDEWGPFV